MTFKQCIEQLGMRVAENFFDRKLSACGALRGPDCTKAAHSKSMLDLTSTLSESNPSSLLEFFPGRLERMCGSD